MATAPTEKRARGPGHALEKPPEVVDFACMRSMGYRAGAHEQKAFEHGMIHNMKKAAGETKKRQHRRSGADAKKPDAQTHHDNADILDAVIREQPFQIVLR